MILFTVGLSLALQPQAFVNVRELWKTSRIRSFDEEEGIVEEK